MKFSKLTLAIATTLGASVSFSALLLIYMLIPKPSKFMQNLVLVESLWVISKKWAKLR